MRRQARLLLATLLALLATGAARADYVADDHEIAAMKAKILKNPPTSATLSAPLYPGAKLDADCSADQSASNQSDPMVYCMYTKDPLDKVKAFIEGPGKPADGVSAVIDRTDVANAQGYVIASDVSQIRYYVSERRKAEARQKAEAQASAPAAAPATAAPETAAATASAAPASSDNGGTAATDDAAAKKKKKKHKEGSDAASEAADAVNALKGIFGH